MEDEETSEKTKIHDQSLAFYMDVGDEHSAAPTRKLATLRHHEVKSRESARNSSGDEPSRASPSPNGENNGKSSPQPHQQLSVHKEESLHDVPVTQEPSETNAGKYQGPGAESHVYGEGKTLPKRNMSPDENAASNGNKSKGPMERSMSPDENAASNGNKSKGPMDDLFTDDYNEYDANSDTAVGEVRQGSPYAVSPDNYTPYDYRYGMPDDGDSDEDDEFGAYASILHEGSVLDEQSLASETPEEMRNPRERVRAAKRMKELQKGKRQQRPHRPQDHDTDMVLLEQLQREKRTPEHIQGRHVNQNIAEGSITSIIGRDNKLDRRTLEIQLRDSHKKLSRAMKEISMLRGKLGKSGITRQIDHCKSIIAKQNATIKELVKNKKGLERVVRSQGKTLSAHHVKGEGDGKIWSEEAQVKILIERVRQLQRTNMDLRDRDKALVHENEHLRQQVQTLKSKLRKSLAREQDGGRAEDHVNEDLLEIREEGRRGWSGNGTAPAPPSQPSLKAKELSAQLEVMAVSMDKTTKEKLALQRLLKTHTSRMENEKLILLKELEAERKNSTRLKANLVERDKEARMHLLTVKKLKKACVDLQSGNKKLEQASAIYTTGLNIENSALSISVSQSQSQSQSHSQPTPPSGLGSRQSQTPRGGSKYRGSTLSEVTGDGTVSYMGSSTFITSSSS